MLLAVGALLVMFAGFPTARRSALPLFAYERAEPLQFLRTTYKIAPLLALSLACLGGRLTAALGAPTALARPARCCCSRSCSARRW